MAFTKNLIKFRDQLNFPSVANSAFSWLIPIVQFRLRASTKIHE